MNERAILRKRLLKSNFFVVGAIVSLIIVLLSLFAPYIIRYDPELPDLYNRLKPPSLVLGQNFHLLGTDTMGRDMLTRLLIGSRVSLSIAVVAVIFSGCVGIITGLVAGYYGGKIDSVIMRFGDVQLSIPAFVLAIAIIAVLGPNVRNLVIVLIITAWVQYARVIRGSVMVIKNMEFISASKVLGASDSWIMMRQILPNVLTPFLIVASQQIGFMILMEAGLSFLGLGVQPPHPSWGNMIADGRDYIGTAPWVCFAPGIALMITVLAFNFLGDGIRDVLDPKMKR